MATKAELIGQSLLKLNGGHVTADTSTRWGEAETYLAYCVNYVMTGSYWADSSLEGERTVNPMLMMPFDNLPVEYDEVRMQKFTTLPKRVLAISKGRGLEVRLMNRRICIPVTQGNSGLQDYYRDFKSEPSYEVESAGKIWWHTIPELVEEVCSRQLVHVQDIDDDEEILLPPDGDVKVIDEMVKFLSGQKQIPADTVQDGKDNK